MKEEVTMKTKVLMLVTAMLVSTSMGMRLEGKNTFGASYQVDF